jgi:catechol 2,3-dioxygenase-like lactoylglutathione lyase family enzyme
MKFNKLIPELTVRDMKKSLDFYKKILGFKMEYERKEAKFAFLSYKGSQIMLDQNNIKADSPWHTGKPEYPFGRGMHLQISTDDIKPIIESLRKNNYPIKSGPKDYWFRKGNSLVGMRGFLVMDPDGYLLMFNEDIGTKKLN